MHQHTVMEDEKWEMEISYRIERQKDKCAVQVSNVAVTSRQLQMA